MMLSSERALRTQRSSSPSFKEIAMRPLARILLKAESLALIDSAYEKAKELKDKGLYISDQLLDNLSRY